MAGAINTFCLLPCCVHPTVLCIPLLPMPRPVQGHQRHGAEPCPSLCAPIDVRSKTCALCIWYFFLQTSTCPRSPRAPRSTPPAPWATSTRAGWCATSWEAIRPPKSWRSIPPPAACCCSKFHEFLSITPIVAGPRDPGGAPRHLPVGCVRLWHHNVGGQSLVQRNFLLQLLPLQACCPCGAFDLTLADLREAFASPCVICSS